MQLRTYFGGVTTIENCNYHLTTLFGTQTLPGENFKMDVTCELVSHVQPLIRHWETSGNPRQALEARLDDPEEPSRSRL